MSTKKDYLDNPDEDTYSKFTRDVRDNTPVKSKVSKSVMIRAYIIHDTGNAILISVSGNKIDEIWIPLSQVIKIIRISNNGPAEITMQAWIAERKGLI